MIRKLASPTRVAAWLGALTLYLAAGCSPPSADEPGDTASDSQALASVSWDVPACSPASLGPSASTCAGPWRYGKKPTQVSRDPSCGVDQDACIAHASCLQWKNGLGPSVNSSDSFSAQLKCTRQCTHPPGEPADCGAMHCTPNLDAAWCTSLAATRRSVEQSHLDVSQEPGATPALISRVNNALTVTGSSNRAFVSQSQSGSSTSYTITTFYNYTCNLAISVPTKTWGVNDTCACVAHDNASCEHAIGGPVVTYSPPGAPAPGGPFVSDVSCTTCDSLAFTDAAGVAAKIACLRNALTAEAPTSVDAATFRRAIVARLELLFDFRGDLMSGADRDAIEDLYAHAQGAPVCHAPSLVDESCSGEGDAVGLNGRVLACQNLDRDDVPLAVIRSQLGFCFEGFDKIAALAPGVCRDLYRRAVTTTTQHLVTRTLSLLGNQSGTITNLELVLGILDSWYQHAQLAVPPDAEPALLASEDHAPSDAALRGSASVLLSAFWQRTNDVIYALPDVVNASNVDTVLNQLGERNYDVEYQVLTTAFAPGAPVRTAPLLSLVGDSLASTVQQLETVSEMHDLACRYRTCSPTSTTQASELWRLIASLPDPGQLDAAVTAATTLRAAHPAMRDAFVAMRARHASLEEAFANASGGVALAEIVGASVLPPEAEQLAALIRLADLRWRNFQSSGLFLGDGARELHAGMQNKALVVQQLAQRVTALDASHASYVQQRVDLVGSLVNELRNGQQEQGLADRMDSIVVRIAQAHSDLVGLAARERKERIAFASYLDAFEKMRDAGVFDANLAAKTTTLPHLEISDADARFTGHAAPPSELAVRYRDGQGALVPWRFPLAAGQSLRFNVQNNWSPSCALQIYGEDAVPGPIGETYHVTDTDAVIGPEGYSLGWNGSSYGAQSLSLNTAVKAFASVEACVKVGVELPGIVEFFFGASAEAWVQACAGLEASVSIEASLSTGANQTTSASFSGGLHLPGTPFPQAPAGALLLVLTSPGSDQIVDVQVADRQAAYVASRDVDAYLVVNDLAPSSTSRCHARAGNPSLAVEAYQVTSFGAVAQELAQAMAESLQEIEAATPAILAQGQLMPSDEALLRLHARNHVMAETGLDLAALQPAVSELFETWLTFEMNSLERRAEMQRHERELQLAELDRLAIAHERAAAGNESRLARLVPRLLMRRLETSHLDQDERAVMRYLRDFVPPIFELRFPHAFRDLLSSPDASVSARAQLDLLERLDFAATGDDIAVLLLDFGMKVSAQLDAATADAADYGVVQVALTFPDSNSYRTDSGPPPVGCGVFAPCNVDSAPPPGLTWHPVEMTRAKQVWDALRAHGQAQLSVTPDDLYDVHGANGQLTCYDGAPIIRKMALYAVSTDGSTWGDLHYRPALQVASEQLFPTAAGSPTYVRTDSDWLFTGLPFLGGPETEALTRLHADDSTAASGLSPFNDFTVDLANFPVPLAQTTQLVVVFDLETHPVAAPGVAIAKCQGH